MPCYRIHRLRAHLRQNFRNAPHVSGVANVKPRDYEPAGTVESEGPYSAFFALRDSESALIVGDLLEDESGDLRIFKFVGFEQARWALPEVKAEEIDPQVAVKPEPSVSQLK